MIRFEPMTESEYVVYCQSAHKNYALEVQKASNRSEEEALKISEESFQKLLPNGIHTEGHWLVSIIEEATQEKVGVLWYGHSNHGPQPSWYIYDIVLNESQRGRGLGKHTLQAFRDLAAHKNIRSIGLHVFEHNPRAIHLYEKMGFKTTDRWMTFYL